MPPGSGPRFTPITGEDYTSQEDYDATVEGRSDEWVKNKSADGWGCLAQILVVLVMVATLLGATFAGNPSSPRDDRPTARVVTPGAPTPTPTTTTTLPLFEANTGYAPPALAPAPGTEQPPVAANPATPPPPDTMNCGCTGG